ncbi:hypothetical protein EDD85DRAFT_797431 [Armillaria nabsnona]|nr:hypothetical protein EDD85DRAFT_797431 [Armillaria nabsnona]
MVKHPTQAMQSERMRYKVNANERKCDTPVTFAFDTGSIASTVEILPLQDLRLNPFGYKSTLGLLTIEVILVCWRQGIISKETFQRKTENRCRRGGRVGVVHFQTQERHPRRERVDRVTHANDVTLRTQMHLIERKCNLFKRVHMNANANADRNSQGNASVQGLNAKFYVPEKKSRGYRGRDWRGEIQRGMAIAQENDAKVPTDDIDSSW